MATATRTRIIQYAPADKAKLSVDLQFANQQLMRDPNMVDMVYRKYAEYTPMGFLGVGIGGNEGIDEVSIGRRDIASTMIRWRALDDTPQPATVTDNLSVPSVIKPGQNFQMSIDEGWYEPDAIFNLQNRNYNLMITGKAPSAGAGTTYTWQLIGMDKNDSSFPVSLLNVGKQLMYGGNSKGEKSSSGQPLAFRHNKAEDFYNVTQFIRHEIDASGHALSNKMWTYFMEQFHEAGKLQEAIKGVLPFSKYALQEHFKKVAHTLYWQTGNFNPLTQEIVNKAGAGLYQDRPTMSGMREQFDSTQHVFHYNPFGDKRKTAEYIERIVTMQRNWLKIAPEDMLEVLILTRDGGEAVLFDVWADRIAQQPIQIHNNTVNGGKVNVGYAIGDFITKKGDKIRFRNLDYAMERGMPTEEVGYGGLGFDRTGFDMYILPIYKVRDQLGRKNITIYTKKNKLSDGTEINRGLVIGYMSGMTGLSNSTGQDAGKALDREIEAAYLSKFQINSPIDQELLMMGSEFSLAVYNVDDIFKLEAKFPSFQ